MDIHAHELLRMMEGNSYTEESLRLAVAVKFGEEARFCTCSANGMNIAEVIEFLKSKGKFKPTDSGFTMDIDKVCDEY